MMELMKELSLTPGVSGSEEKIANIIKRELKDVADSIEEDSMGNVIATKKGEKKAPTVMLASHMDEIGLMVRYIDEKGYVEFSTIGGINDQMHESVCNYSQQHWRRCSGGYWLKTTSCYKT